jgi:hypothetical protein
VVNRQMPWVGLSWVRIYTGGSREGTCTSKHTRDIVENKEMVI